jgi:hypothetical protein
VSSRSLAGCSLALQQRRSWHNWTPEPLTFYGRSQCFFHGLTRYAFAPPVVCVSQCFDVGIHDCSLFPFGVTTVYHFLICGSLRSDLDLYFDEKESQPIQLS